MCWPGTAVFVTAKGKDGIQEKGQAVCVFGLLNRQPTNFTRKRLGTMRLGSPTDGEPARYRTGLGEGNGQSCDRDPYPSGIQTSVCGAAGPEPMPQCRRRISYDGCRRLE